MALSKRCKGMPMGHDHVRARSRDCQVSSRGKRDDDALEVRLLFATPHQNIASATKCRRAHVNRFDTQTYSMQSLR